MKGVPDMASKKREMEFEANRNRYRAVQSGFRFSAITGLICTGAVFLIMDIYYIIRVFAMMAGGSLVMGQAIVTRESGEVQSTGLEFSFPYGFMAYLLLMTLLSLASNILKKRYMNKLMLILYAISGMYGIIGLFTGHCEILKGVYLFAVGIYGVWLQSYVLGLHKELDHLALQEGFPDFIPALAEPKTMANTITLTRTQSDFLIRQRQERKKNGEVLPPPAKVEMDELTLDTPIPKSDRKIDNLM